MISFSLATEIFFVFFHADPELSVPPESNVSRGEEVIFRSDGDDPSRTGKFQLCLQETRLPDACAGDNGGGATRSYYGGLAVENSSAKLARCTSKSDGGTLKASTFSIRLAGRVVFESCSAVAAGAVVVDNSFNVTAGHVSFINCSADLEASSVLSCTHRCKQRCRI